MKSLIFSQKQGTNGVQLLKWKTEERYPGIRYREHPTRKHGIKPDRYFQIRYYVDGERIEESLGWASSGMTFKEAAEIRAELTKAHRTGEGPVTLKERRDKSQKKRAARAAKSVILEEYFLKHYLPWAKQKKKTGSWEKEESHYRIHIGPLLGHLPVREVELKQWDALVQRLSQAKLSTRTKEYITGTLRRIMRHAYDRRVIDSPPPSGKRVGVTAPRDNRRLRVITPKEAEAILDYLEVADIHAWRIVKFAFLTGCRASEAFNLRWRDIGFEAGALVFTDTKNKDSRSLPLTPSIQDLLESIGQGRPDAHVFTKPEGSPYPQAPSPFKTAVQNLGFNDGRTVRDRITFHSIRHTVATNLAKKLNLRDLMEAMGWRTVQMAMRYVHGDETLKRNALASLENSLSSAGGKVLPFTPRTEAEATNHE